MKYIEWYVLFGTYYVQYEIWKHQFPATWKVKRNFDYPLISTGMGSFFIFWLSLRHLNWAIKWSKLLKYRYNWLVWHSLLQFQSVVIVMLYMMNCTLFYIGWWKFIWKRDSYSLVISNSLLVSYCQSIKYQYISFDEL